MIARLTLCFEPRDHAFRVHADVSKENLVIADIEVNMPILDLVASGKLLLTRPDGEHVKVTKIELADGTVMVSRTDPENR